jgi:hypothetical protein
LRFEWVLEIDANQLDYQWLISEFCAEATIAPPSNAGPAIQS